MAITREQARKLLEAYKFREDLQARMERLLRDKEQQYPVVIQLDDGTKIQATIPRTYVQERLSQQMMGLDEEIRSNGGVP